LVRPWPLLVCSVLLVTVGHRFIFGFSDREASGDKGSAGLTSNLDPGYKRMLMYLLVGSKGGFNRMQMIKLLKDEPLNANKIGERLSLDYKTVQHHLRILVENNIVVTNSAGTYGAMYFLTPYFEKHIGILDEIWARLGKR
jgi:DNA-binding transcriptional ArsR family regulator